ncbi:hypothetical protein ACOMHN_049801 [Nucella lapillus]
MNIKVNGKEVSALVDTGSQVTLMPYRVYQDLFGKKGVRLHEARGLLRVTAANGLDVPYLGYFEADIEVNGIIVSGRGILVKCPSTRESKGGPSQEAVILGMNVLQALPPGTLPLPPMLGGLARVARGRPVFIPPNSTAVVQVTGIGNSKRLDRPSEVLVEPCPGSHLPRGLIVGSCLSSVQGCSCFVQVANLTDEGITLKPGSIVGTIQRVQADIVPEEVQVEVSCDRIHVCAARSTTPVCSQECPVDLQHVDCTAEQKAQLERLVLANRDLFCSDDEDLGYTEKVMHRMRLKDDIPVASTFRRIPPTQLQEVKEHIQTLLSKKIIQQSSSPYASPVVIVRKKDGSIRLCVDYRRLNSKTIPDAYPLPRIDDSLDALGGAKVFSTLDLASGYHQVAMSPEDRQKTAFITPFGLFEYLRMPMGLSTAPATFQRLMQMTMNDLAFQILLVYLDDLLIYSKSFEEHLQRLQTVFDRLREVGLTLNPKKCHLVWAEVEYLGYTISGEEIATSKDKVTAVKSWPALKTLHDLRSFLGFASYYRRFVQGFAKVAKPLHQLISQTYQKEKGQKRKSKKVDVSRDWNAGCQSAFQELKDRLTSAPVLGYVDFSLPFILETDASLDGLGSVLSQEQNGKHRVIAYASRSLRPGERMMKNDSSMKLEVLALKWAMCDKFRYYLLGAHTEVYTDNNPLSHLQTAKLGAVEQRWAAELASFEFSVKYRAGRENANADALSRNPVEEPEEEEEFTAVLCAHEVGQPGMFATTIDPVGTPIPDFESIIESPQQKEPGENHAQGRGWPCHYLPFDNSTTMERRSGKGSSYCPCSALHWQEKA